MNYPNRVVCSVLSEMRKMLKTLNIFTLYRYKAMQATLIEEAQTLVNRMEAGLEDWSDIKYARKDLKSIRKEIRELKDEKEALKEELGKKKEVKSSFEQMCEENDL